MEQNINKNIFITGANGFLGRKITSDLAKEGYKIKAIVREIKWQDKNIKFIKGNLLDIEKLGIDRNNFGAVIHMAASKRMYERKGELYRDNYLLTKKLINYFDKTKTYFIYFSSIEAYGPTGEKKVKINEKEKPISDYGKIKLKTEKLIKKSKLNYAILRIGNVEGKNEGLVNGIKKLKTDKSFYSKIQTFFLSEILSDYELNIIKIEDLSKIIQKILKLKPKNKLFYLVSKRIKIKEIFCKDGNFKILLPVVFLLNKLMAVFKMANIVNYISCGGKLRKYRNYEANY